nr:hypothetical protein [Tanacetum cinerariifolium]
MANLSSAKLVYDEAGPSYDFDTLSEVQDHDNSLDNMNESHEEHEMQNDVQPNDVVDSDTEYTSNSNIISYEQYVQDNEVQVVQSDASSVPNDASFYDEVNMVAIGYKNRFYLSKAKQVQPDLYNGYETIKTNHDRALVHDSEDTLEIAETTRKQMIRKMKDPMNNKEVYLDYLRHLKESVGTIREIVKEVRVEKPLDCSLASTCLYTKHSQELLEYVIGTCSKDFNKKDRKIAIALLNRKKRVTFVEPGVKDATTVSGSKPRSTTKKDRTLPAKSDKKKVEDHSRNKKSRVKQKNRVDSSISYKRT